jgi:hypothetical protein
MNLNVQNENFHKSSFLEENITRFFFAQTMEANIVAMKGHYKIDLTNEEYIDLAIFNI